jgi:hypothetical protein
MGTLVHSGVSGLYANPLTVLASGQNQSPVFCTEAALEVATGDIDASDIIHLCALPWNAKIKSIRMFNDDLDSHGTPTLTTDLGLYKMSRDGTFTVLDADAYASAITGLQAADKVGTEVAFESGIKDINAADSAKTVMEDAGLTAVPRDFTAVLALTITNAAATAVAGTIKVTVLYTL